LLHLLHVLLTDDIFLQGLSHASIDSLISQLPLHVQLAEELIHLLRKKQKELIHFGDDIAYAANSLRDKDHENSLFRFGIFLQPL
jgi:hypothetical protein